MFLRPSELNKIDDEIFCKNYIPLIEAAPTMIFGKGGRGKSYIAIRCACEYALETGNKVALWLTEDTQAQNRIRFVGIVKTFYPNDTEKLDELITFITHPPVKFTKMDGGNPVITQEYWKWREILQDFGMVAMDPLLQFQGCNENDNTHAGVFMVASKQWSDEEFKVLLYLHHATHDESNGLKPRGATEWSNGCRAVYSLDYIYNGQSNEIANEHINDRFINLYKDNGVGRYFLDHNRNKHRFLEVFAPYTAGDTHRTNDRLHLSFAPHNSTSPTDFVWTEVEFSALHALVSSGKAYSPYNYQNNYRRGNNNLGGATMLCFDFDSGTTLEKAKQTFSKHQSLIITTKSHQIDKGGVACDRFRVFLPLLTQLDIPVSGYSEFLNYLFNEMQSQDLGVDPATKDTARFYMASPDDAFYHYSDSTMRWNWEPVFKKMRKREAVTNVQKMLNKPTSTKIHKSKSGTQKNTLPADTKFITEKGELTLKELRDSLPGDAKVPCHCHAGIDHGGAGPNHYSAFIKKAENGNVFYSCSGGRCAGVGTLWCDDIDPDE